MKQMMQTMTQDIVWSLVDLGTIRLLFHGCHTGDPLQHAQSALDIQNPAFLDVFDVIFLLLWTAGQM